MTNQDEYVEGQSPDFGYVFLFEIMDAVWIFGESAPSAH